MSPNVGNFVHDLVEMAKAMETLPMVQAENDRLQQVLDQALANVQDRELSILSLKSENENLYSRIRSLEVERDDASFRVLEAEDREHTATAMARSIASALGNLVATLDPPKPEPLPEPQTQPADTPVEGQDSSGWNHNIEPTSEAVHSIFETGQSESRPTANTGPVPENAGQSPVLEKDAGSTYSATSSVDPGPALGPYFGKRYIDVSGWVAYDDWLNGGGTHDNYWAGRS